MCQFPLVQKLRVAGDLFLPAATFQFLLASTTSGSLLLVHFCYEDVGGFEVFAVAWAAYDVAQLANGLDIRCKPSSRRRIRFWLITGVGQLT